MRPETTLRRFERTLQAWRDALGAFEDAQFTREPRRGGWSAARVAEHVVATADVLLTHAQECTDGGGEPGRSGTLPFLMTLAGSFPPVRIRVRRVPDGLEHVYEPLELGRAETLEELERVLERMRTMADKVAADRGTFRRRHWAAGWFNARQWFQLAEMHTRHHLRQLRRLRRG